jgi:hypothetical protein
LEAAVIAYVDKPPIIDPNGDSFLLTFQSGEESIKLMLTPHAAFYLERKLAEAKARAAVAALGKEPVKFPTKRRQR